MAASERLVVYYSCFNLTAEVDQASLTHTHSFKATVLQCLGQEFINALQRELELLNVRPAKLCVELLSEVWLKIARRSPDYTTFKNELVRELDLSKIWTPNNPECVNLENLLQQFISVVQDLPLPEQFQLKLLPSAQRAPELEPLMVAREQEQTFSQRIYKVLQRVSTPFEALIGQELMESLKQYMKHVSQKVSNTYQVTSDFVTNIIEVRPLTQNVQVRIIQPAKEYYDKALEAFLALNSHVNSQLFMQTVRQRLGQVWNEKLVAPTLHFFKIAEEEWSHSLNTQEFLRALEQRLYQTWMQSIVQSSLNFQHHMVPKTIL